MKTVRAHPPQSPDIRALSFDCNADARLVLEKLFGPARVVMTDGEIFNLYYLLTKPVRDREGQRKFKEIGGYITAITEGNARLNLEFCCIDYDTLIKEYPMPEEP